MVLDHLPHFSIWGAGRDGKKLFNNLKKPNQDKVLSLWDIDPKRVGTVYDNTLTGHRIPVIHFSEGKDKTPVITCIACGRDGAFERNLSTLELVEGVDYFMFG